MSDLLFLNLLRTSLIVGALTLILTLLSPFWDRRFSARWKKRLWYLLSLVLLAGIFFPIPGGRAPIWSRSRSKRSRWSTGRAGYPGYRRPRLKRLPPMRPAIPAAVKRR